jgi:hypothetical protein
MAALGRKRMPAAMFPLGEKRHAPSAQQSTLYISCRKKRILLTCVKDAWKPSPPYSRRTASALGVKAAPLRGGMVVQNYRFYCYARGGSLWADDRIEADDDDQAMMLVRSMKDAIIVEVWQGPRLVGTIQQPNVSGMSAGG